MGNYTYEGENQKKIEVFMLCIYSVYTVSMMCIAAENESGGWMSYAMLIGLAAAWCIYIGKIRTYVFRARMVSILMQLSLIMYAMNLNSITQVLPVILAFVVFMGLYGQADIIYLTPVTTTIIFVYHILIANRLSSDNLTLMSEFVSRIINVYLIEYVVYIWTKRNSEGSRRLLHVIDELKAVESSKDDFLANVSHEFRTPINTICGMSEIILQEELPYRIKENVQDIQIAGRNLMSIVSDILDFSELQSGKMELEEEAYNITSTINDVINMSLAKKNEKKIELIVDCDANIPCALMGDEKKLRRVIMNLVDNAMKFTEEGFVSITIGYRKETYGINLVVSVKDTGIGIDDAGLEKVFAQFSQADMRRNRQESGIGLGLAISYALIQKMGGAITIKSKLGKGTMVQFVVPQKVLDEQPILALNDKINVNVATYIDMEQFDMVAIRDEYSKTIVNMVEQLRGRCHICRSFAELQRRYDNEHFSHIFISVVEYRAHKEYFDSLAEKTKVIVVLDRFDEKYVTGACVLKIYKPLYILSIVALLNGLGDSETLTGQDGRKRFYTENAHVLVVDDNRMNLRVIEGLLQDYNIKVTTALSGKDALDKIVTSDYDFVFMDHMMPEMDGVETLHRIRHKVGTYYQKVPIVALTANAVAGTREMLIKEGFSDFLEKPIERSVLERVLKRNLSEDKILYSNSMEETVASNDFETDSNIGTIIKSLEAKGLDVEKGILYCNGKEQYISILQGYCEDYEATGNLCEKLFAQKDWKNYTITVHGMKSAMRSIGANPVAECARLLEMAGKEGKVDYILDNHNELMKQYNKLFEELNENSFLAVHEKNAVAWQDDAVEYPEISEEEFERILEEMEDAMYSLDDKRLKELLKNLQQYKYCNQALVNALAPVERKFEMSDYMSAVEMVARIKTKIAAKR